MERIYRNRRITPEELARDQDLRERITEEFPPLRRASSGELQPEKVREQSVIEPSADALLEIAQSLAVEWNEFFQKKGPGAGDLDTNAFMKKLRDRAREQFGHDFAEQSICGDSKLAPDFYFPHEETIVEIAMELRNPASEFERDILKAVIAQDSSHPVRRLVFLSKPGAKARTSQPGMAAFAQWVQKNRGISVEVREFTPVAEVVLETGDETAGQ